MNGYDRVGRGFKKLEGKWPSRDSIEAIAIGAEENPKDIQLAKDSSNQYRLILQCPDAFARTDPGLGPIFPVAWDLLIAQNNAELNVLHIICVDDRFLPTFRSLIGELLDRVDETGNQGIVELFEVIESWRKTISRAGKKISQAVEVGLFGELYVLSEMARIRPDEALESWRGRAHFRHDFSLTNSIEVKTFTNADSPKVTINGARQLEPPPYGTLTLVAIGVEEARDGQTIEDLIDEISIFIPGLRIREQIREEYVAGASELRRLAVMDIRIHEVGELFPGIRESQLPPHALLGVDNLKYSITLDACPPPSNATITELLKEL